MTTAVLLCGRGMPSGAPIPDGSIMLGDLCERPGQITEAAAGAHRLVLGVCRERFSRGRSQTAARAAGLDPLGIRFVDLDSATADPGRLEVTLAGAIARAGAFPGSAPHHAKLAIPDALSRRQLLRSLVPEYRAAPAISVAACRAPDGCRACIAACPRGALRREGGRTIYDRARCEPCGRCVTACPVGAIENPAVTPAALAAEVAALVGHPGPGPRAIAFTCERGTAELGAGWFAVRVPCVSMVTVTWLLAPLLMGAGASALIPCSASGCSLAYDGTASATVEFAAAFLAAAEIAEPRVRGSAQGPVGAPWPPSDVANPFGTNMAAAVLTRIAAHGHGSAGPVAGARAPAGLVTIDPDACTLCGRCAHGCPTGALAATETAGAMSLSFDASTCPACEQCLAACPELERGAIQLHRCVDLTALASGRTVALTGRMRACDVCGGPVASERLLAHFGAVLGEEHAAALTAIARRCTPCRRIPTA